MPSLKTNAGRTWRFLWNELEALTERPLQRIGLSATQKPIDEVARLLVGSENLSADARPKCEIVDVGHKRDMDLRVELPDQELGAIATHEMWAEVYEKIVAQVKAHRRPWSLSIRGASSRGSPIS